MQCQIGITTDPDRREQEWRAQYPHLRFWPLEWHATKDAAQSAENRLKRAFGCEGHPGGRPPEDEGASLWCVYKVDF